jgi:hypothetical protein
MVNDGYEKTDVDNQSSRSQFYMPILVDAETASWKYAMIFSIQWF